MISSKLFQHLDIRYHIAKDAGLPPLNERGLRVLRYMWKRNRRPVQAV